MTSKEEIHKLIINEISGFLKSGSKGATQGKLAQKTGIPKTTINRYALNEGANAAPKADIAFAFLSFFRGPNVAAQLMRKAYKKWWNSTGQFIGNSAVFPDSDGSFQFSHVHVSILAKASCKKGLSDEWIIENYGKKIGIPARDDLLIRKYIVHRCGVNYAVSDRVIESNRLSILSMVKAEIEGFPIDFIGEKAFIWFLSEAVSQSTRKEILGILNDALKKIREARERGLHSDEEKTEILKLVSFGDWVDDTNSF